MTPADLRDLVEYNYWARDRVLRAASALAPDQLTRQVGGSFGSVLGTLVHIYSAEWIWHSRWTGVSPTAAIPADRFADLAGLVEAWHEVEGHVRTFVERLADEETKRQIDYRLLNGTPGRASFQHMLQHLVNHGSYHRGQVTTQLRLLGASPPQSTDLIAYLRERAALLK
jgi:uncharacterized damage-inducible protein DinB